MAGLLLLAGLTLTVGYFVVLAKGDYFWGNWTLRQYHPSAGGAVWHFGQTGFGLAAAVALQALGAWEVREWLWRRTVTRVVTSEPPLLPGSETGILVERPARAGNGPLA